MVRRLEPFLADERGKLTEQIVNVILLVIVVGGLLITILGGLGRIWEDVRLWTCDVFPAICR